MRLEVHPYSMRPVSPETRMAQWKSLFMEFIMPASQMLQQQGKQVDVFALIKKLAGYMNIPDLDEVLRELPTDPMLEAEAANQEGPRVRPPGVGQYTRTNVSSPESQDQDVMAMMSQGDAA
jgi:hypothetical protein